MDAPVVAALAAMCVVGGVMLAVVGLEPVPVSGRPPSHRTPGPIAWARGDHLSGAARRAHRLRLGSAAVAGALVWLFTGWLIAVVAVPVAVMGVPMLLSAPASATDVEKLTAIEQWTRGLSGVLTIGTGIEHALTTSLGSTPAPIRPQVADLVARLGARWPVENALRAFADDLHDATGDLVAASLILGARRRGPGLAAVLDDLAATVAEEVRIRRGIEADRARPRTTARWVTFITLGVLALLTLNGDYMAPYRTPLGQVAFVVLLCLYAGCLLWMRHMTIGRPTPRFLPATDVRG